MNDSRAAAIPPRPVGDQPEVVELLARLIRAETANPPGDVRPAAGVLAEPSALDALTGTRIRVPAPSVIVSTVA